MNQSNRLLAQSVGAANRFVNSFALTFSPNSNHRQPQDSDCVFYLDRLVNLSAIQANGAGADDPGNLLRITKPTIATVTAGWFSVQAVAAPAGPR